MGDVYGMKFDRYGRRVKAFASVESQNAIGPETMKMLESMGIKTLSYFVSDYNINNVL